MPASTASFRASTSPSPPTVKDAGMQVDTTTTRPRILACPVCGTSDLRARFTVGSMAIQTCAGCGLVLQNPQPSDRELASIYGNNYFIGSSDQDRYASQFDLVKRGTARLQLD